MLVDPTGRLPGRGAYLCRDAGCWDRAHRKRSLEHALGVAIPDDVFAAVGTLAASPATAAPSANHRATGAEPEPDDPQGGAHGPK